MQTELSLPCAQQPVTCPYREPDHSTPRPQYYFFKIRF